MAAKMNLERFDSFDDCFIFIVRCVQMLSSVPVVLIITVVVVGEDSESKGY
jgi:hypothetical protein